MNSTSYESFAQSRPTTRHSRSSPVTPSSVSTCSCRDHDCFPSSSTYVEDFKIQDADNQHIETLDTSQVPCEDSNVDMNSVLRSAVALAFGAEQARQESAQMAATTEKKNRFKIWRRKNSKKTCSSGKVSPRTSGDSAQSRNKGKAVAVDDGGTTADVDVAVDPKMDEAEDTENYIIRTGSPLNNSAAGSNRAWVDEDRVEAEMEERDPSVSHKRIDSAVEPVDGQGPIGIAQ
ncbi:hypothetical protein ANO11243_094940 [Dothideomycetidae sp. 11243]|nr:hypothetical protein ANO11243_094940 [fungal sp. No.11243]